ncbi:hypothetical protein FXO38_18781 [Capsicum annuum]|nr:hypothetical protein FXO38_18781 [Capsicum annuum]
MVKGHKAVKKVASPSCSSRKRKTDKGFITSKRKKASIEETKSESESKTLAEIKEFDESSAHKSDDVEDNEGESEEKNESYNGKDEDKRDKGDGEEDDPLSLLICARDISVEPYAYPCESKTKKILQNGERFHFKVTKNKSITAARLIILIKGHRLTNQQKLKRALVWFVHLMLLAKDPSKKIMHPYLTPTVREMEQRYMKIFNPYTNEVKDTSIDVFKAMLKGVTVLTSLEEVADKDEDLSGHNYVPSPARACDHAGSSRLKTEPNAFNDEDLLHLDSTLHSRHQLNLEELAFIVTDIAATDEKVKEEKKEETEEEKVTNEQDKKEEEEEEEEDDDDEEITTEEEAGNEEKIEEDSEKKSEEGEEKNEKAVDEVVDEQEVENIE